MILDGLCWLNLPLSLYPVIELTLTERLVNPDPRTHPLSVWAVQRAESLIMWHWTDQRLWTVVKLSSFAQSAQVSRIYFVIQLQRLYCYQSKGSHARVPSLFINSNRITRIYMYYWKKCILWTCCHIHAHQHPLSLCIRVLCRCHKHFTSLVYLISEQMLLWFIIQ